MRRPVCHAFHRVSDAVCSCNSVIKRKGGRLPARPPLSSYFYCAFGFGVAAVLGTWCFVLVLSPLCVGADGPWTIWTKDSGRTTDETDGPSTRYQVPGTTYYTEFENALS